MKIEQFLKHEFLTQPQYSSSPEKISVHSSAMKDSRLTYKNVHIKIIILLYVDIMSLNLGIAYEAKKKKYFYQ
jgi:hypothetical protein